MVLGDNWFYGLAENEEGEVITIQGRDGLEEFIKCGKYPERVEISWKYDGDANGMPSEEVSEKMMLMETTLRKAMEKKDKLGILTGVYTGGNEKTWVFYTRIVRVFGERLNDALKELELFPITIYTEKDQDWAEYKEMTDTKNEEL